MDKNNENESLRESLEIEQEMMNNPEYTLIDYLAGRTNLFKAKHNKLGRIDIIAKGLISQIEQRRPREEFDCRSDEHMSKIVKATQKCPYLVTIYAHRHVGEEENMLLYTAMKFVEGPPASAIKSFYQTKKISLEDAINFFSNLCEGVQALHDAEFIHRDLKYLNVYVIKMAGKHIPIIIDFNHGCGLNSQTVHMVGTPGFKAPEAYPNEKNKKTYDVFPLGVMLWETLDIKKKETEYFSDECKKLVNEQKNKELTDQEIVDIFLKKIKQQPVGNKYLTEIICQAMRPNPMERYQSAREMRTDLCIAKNGKLFEALINQYSQFDAEIGNRIDAGKQFADITTKLNAIREQDIAKKFCAALDSDAVTDEDFGTSYLLQTFLFPKTIDAARRRLEKYTFKRSSELKTKEEEEKYLATEMARIRPNFPAEDIALCTDIKNLLEAQKIYANY